MCKSLLYRTSARIWIFRACFFLQNMGEERAALEERIEELQSENDILREEVELARSVAQTNRSGDGDLDTASITERLERSERAVVTKSHLVELLSSEVQRLDFELRSAREELAQQCVSRFVLLLPMHLLS